MAQLANQTVLYMRGAGTSLRYYIVVSLIVHLLIFVIFPVLMSAFWSNKLYERPTVFQLVSAPEQPQQRSRSDTKRPKSDISPKEPKSKKEVPAKKPENVNELSSLLEDIAPPTTEISAPAGFKSFSYLNLVRAKIERYWTPPINNPKVTVVVEFTIFSNGSISPVQIRQSSGDNVLDNLAVRAVTLAAPFGKLPVSYPGNELDIRLTLHPTRQ